MMNVNASEISSVITSISTLLAAIGSIVSVLTSLRNGRKIEQVRDATNGMKKDLVKATGEQKFAEGVQFGKDNPHGAVTPARKKRRK